MSANVPVYMMLRSERCGKLYRKTTTKRSNMGRGAS